jgi:PPM family protein phosphatase
MIITEFSRASIDHPERNEDAVMIFAGDENFAPVFAVIDGMGGHQHADESGKMITGQDASQLVRTVLVEDLLRLPLDVSAAPNAEAQQKVTAVLERANERILQTLNRGDLGVGHRVGAVTTVAIVCEGGSRLLIGQVGDTRAYVFSEGDLIQLCDDEDNVAYLIELGLLSDEDGQRITEILNTFDGINEPKVSGQVSINGQPYEMYLAWRWFLSGNAALGIPGGNTVIRALGIQPKPLTVQISRIEIARGDKLFLCSDGIYKNLSEAEIIQFLQGWDSATKSGLAAYERSQDDLNRRSTVDDISAICVEF